MGRTYQSIVENNWQYAVVVRIRIVSRHTV